MRPIAFLCALVLALLPWHTAAAKDEFPDIAISTVTDCYNNAVTKEDEVVQCIQKKINSIPNPLDYNLTVRTSEPDSQGQLKIIIFMVNNTGYMIYCIGQANNTSMSINSCATEQGKPLSPSQALSIDSLLKGL